MYFFDSCGDEYHICGVNNLYMSDKFFKDTFNYNKKINLHGVTRKSVSGIPESIVQDEVSNKKDQEKVRGTVCASELIGEKYCPLLIAVSVYYTKLVHF